MASVTLDASLLEIAKSLDVEKAPDKLRCGACHKLNVNAYKTTCCDTYICESCFTESCDQSCPKCDHKPFTAETCKPNKSMRLTIKSYLKAAEKATTEAHERAKPTTYETAQAEIAQQSVNGEVQEEELVVEVEAEQAVDAAENGDNSAHDVQPSVEDPELEVGDNFEDEVDIQVDLDDDHQEIPLQRLRSTEATPNEQSHPPTGPKSSMPDMSNGTSDGMGGMDFQTMMNGFGNMDYNQMMQMMAANGMGGINPMMGMPIGMNPMSAGMFGGFGQNGGMNGTQGMNMGMNFNPNQGMFPGWNNQNNNMWQNNNANAFSNGMGGDFGSNYGFNMGASGNFQQSYPNGDFQGGYYGRGYGRGRGRGRGGFGRGRGNFNQYSQYQQQQGYYNNGPGQQNFQNQSGDRPNGALYEQKADGDNKIEDSTHEDDEFAPGGQEEVQEALGDDYQKTSVEEKTVTDDTVTQNDGNDLEQNGESRIEAGDDEPAPLDDRAPIKPADIDENVPIADGNKSVPEAYSEDLHTPMPPPSAPLGPSAQYGGRGHGRFSTRGRGSMSQTNGHFAPPVKPFTPPSEPKGVGVVGAPTGPRAMREPPAPAPARPASRAANAGFQIMGRASMARSPRSESRDIGSAHSKSPVRDHQEDKYDDQSRGSRQETRASSRHDNAEQDYESRDKDRRSKKSKRDTYDDYDRDEHDGSYDRSDSADRKSSRRSCGDKEKSSSSRHRSSRSKRYDEDGVNGDYEMKDHDDSSRSVRDEYYGESRSKHRSTKSSKYDDRDRDHDRKRDRDRDRDRTRDDGRNEKHRDRDHDHERDRKRSRHDRHREDNKEHSYDYDYEHERDEDAPDSRHRSRRHKKDHRRDGEDTNERSHKSSASTTPAAAAPEKDPHTLEREARNRERMVKEQQRREKAAKGGGGAGRESGRRVTYKYEDELERGLVEGERASARWR